MSAQRPEDESQGGAPVDVRLEPETRSRRELAAVALVAAGMLRTRRAGAAPAGGAPGRAGAGAFFGPLEMQTLEALAEQIIPTDERSPGARQAGAPATIDRFMGELQARFPEQRKQRLLWKRGLARIDRAARAKFREPYAGLDFAAQRELLEAWANSSHDLEKAFFDELKAKVAWAYYTSEVGLHQEIGYLGNTYAAEFDGEPLGPPLSQVFASLELKVP